MRRKGSQTGMVRAWSVFQASLAAVSDVFQEKEDGLWFSFCGCVRDDGHVMVRLLRRQRDFLSVIWHVVSHGLMLGKGVMLVTLLPHSGPCCCR